MRSRNLCPSTRNDLCPYWHHELHFHYPKSCAKPRSRKNKKLVMETFQILLNGFDAKRFIANRDTWAAHYIWCCIQLVIQEKNRTTLLDSKPTEAIVILVNLVGRHFTRVLGCAPHTFYLQVTFVFCQIFRQEKKKKENCNGNPATHTCLSFFPYTLCLHLRRNLFFCICV